MTYHMQSIKHELIIDFINNCISIKCLPRHGSSVRFSDLDLVSADVNVCECVIDELIGISSNT